MAPSVAHSSTSIAVAVAVAVAVIIIKTKGNSAGGFVIVGLG